MATGVLIMGVGKGTKQLQGFLECTKTYEATVLFGAATDSYDILGKVLRRVPHGHVTRERVEEALDNFRGKIMQRPPIYSALRVQGKRLYEYARENKEVPVKIESRPVEVRELEIIEWLDGGTHEYKVPGEEAEEESKELAEKVLHLGEGPASSATDVDTTIANGVTSPGTKRKRSLEDDFLETVTTKKPALTHQEMDPETLMSGGLQDLEDAQPPSPSPHSPSINLSHNARRPTTEPPSQPEQPPPAVKLRITSTSGFYVRSLAHDLGEAVGSLACMSALVRTRQGGFELGKNVLEYEDLDKREEVWGPKVEGLLDAWAEKEVGEEREEEKREGGEAESEARWEKSEAHCS